MVVELSQTQVSNRYFSSHSFTEVENALYNGQAVFVRAGTKIFCPAGKTVYDGMEAIIFRSVAKGENDNQLSSFEKLYLISNGAGKGIIKVPAEEYQYVESVNGQTGAVELSESRIVHPDGEDTEATGLLLYAPNGQPFVIRVSQIEEILVEPYDE